MADAKEISTTHYESRERSSSDNSLRKDEETSSSELEWTEEEEKKLVRKIDFRVFPMMCIVFGLSLLDRTNISAAYIAGKELGLRGLSMLTSARSCERFTITNRLTLLNCSARVLHWLLSI